MRLSGIDPQRSCPRHAHSITSLALSMVRTGCDCADSLADLLCDLMHWSDRARLSFADALYSASFHYAAEVAGEDVP